MRQAKKNAAAAGACAPQRAPQTPPPFGAAMAARSALAQLSKSLFAAAAGVAEARAAAAAQRARAYSSAFEPADQGTYLDKEAVTERVVEVVKAFGKVDAAKVNPEAHFTNDLGLDSLDTVEVRGRARRRAPRGALRPAPRQRRTLSVRMLWGRRRSWPARAASRDAGAAQWRADARAVHNGRGARRVGFWGRSFCACRTGHVLYPAPACPDAR